MPPIARPPKETIVHFPLVVYLLWRREANVHAATMISSNGMSLASSLRLKLLPGVPCGDAFTTRLSVATPPRCLDGRVRPRIAFRLARVPPNPFYTCATAYALTLNERNFPSGW